MAAICVHAPSLAMVYASSFLDLGEVLAGAREVLGQTLLLGATTAGEISGGIRHQTVVVVVVASPYLRVRAAIGKGVSADWELAFEEALSAPALQEWLAPSPERTREYVRKGMVKLMACLEKGERKQAHDIAHNLKGVSANLSATGLAKAAKALDDVVRDESRELDPELLARLVEGVEQELARLRRLQSDDEGVTLSPDLPGCSVGRLIFGKPGRCGE